MLFSELLKSAQIDVIRQDGDAEITAVVADSRRCGGGSCFLAVKGWTDDGHKYIPSAVGAGCSAIVCEDPSTVPQGMPFAVVGNARMAVGRLAQAFRGWPARKLTCVAVTGTNGKSTTACLVRDILQAVGHKPALLGTITYETGGRVIDASQTTPDPIALADMMAEMVAAGRSHLVMEASSHALHQDRTAGVDFRVGVFSNLTGDHLDYHKTMEEYLAAKRRLFENLAPDAFAVINVDDQAGAAMAKSTTANVIGYGLAASADLLASVQESTASGTTFEMLLRQPAGCRASIGPQQSLVRSPLIGKHNVYNCLAAAGACAALGIPIETIAAVLAGVKVVPGRLERVDVEAPYHVYVDYAHTDDALVNVLGALRPVTKKRLILVFGCGGDRDRTKRPRMAQVAGQLADHVVVTSDNPRSEQPMAIINEILTGFSEPSRSVVDVQVDRNTAITKAISMAHAGDIVLIAGKGHEKYQIVGKEKLDFDDVQVAAAAMRNGSKK